MGNIAYDWSPLFGAIAKATDDIGQRNQYQNTLRSMFGNPQFNPVTITPQVSGPGLPNTPGATPFSDPARQAAYTAPAQSFSGPVGQALGFDQASALAPLLKGLPPSMGMPLLMQSTQAAMQRKQELADKKITPISDQEAQDLGLRSGGVYGRDAAGNIQTIQASDLKSQGAIDQGIQQSEDLSKFDNQLPMTLAQQDAARSADATLAETSKHDRADEDAKLHPFGIGGSAANGDEFLKTLPPGIAAQVKAIANYRQLPPNSRSNTGIALMSAVNQYDPDYDGTTFNTKQKARNDYGTGVQGKSIVAINNAVAHLDLLGQIADAMGNGDIQMINQIRQAYAQQTGSAAPTTFDAVRNIAAQEVVKSVVPGGGGVAERAAAAEDFKKAASPQQIHGAINGVKGLFSGQLGNYRRQYQKLTGLKDFNDFLSPETLGLTNMPVSQAAGIAPSPAAAPAAGGGWSNFRAH